MTLEDKATERLIRAEVNIMARLKRETQVVQARVKRMRLRSKSGSVMPADDEGTHGDSKIIAGGGSAAAVQQGKPLSASNANAGGAGPPQVCLCVCLFVCVCTVCVYVFTHHGSSCHHGSLVLHV
jgi:hypothetical protein